MKRSSFHVDKNGRMFVGTYTLTSHRVDVFLANSDGSSFWWPLNAKSEFRRATMVLDADCEWYEVVKGAVHEAFEAATMMHQCLLRRQTFLCDNSTGKNLFQMDHSQFTEIADEVGDLLTYLLPDAAEAYRQWKKVGGKR